MCKRSCQSDGLNLVQSKIKTFAFVQRWRIFRLPFNYLCHHFLPCHHFFPFLSTFIWFTKYQLLGKTNKTIEDMTGMSHLFPNKLIACSKQGTFFFFAGQDNKSRYSLNFHGQPRTSFYAITLMPRLLSQHFVYTFLLTQFVRVNTVL